MITKWYSVEDGQIEELIHNGLDEIIKKLNLNEKIIVNKQKVLESIDEDKIAEKLVENYTYTNVDEPDHRDVVHNLVDSIDELFQR